MDFSLSDEQLMIKDTTRKLLHSLGLTNIARKFMEGDTGVLFDTWKQIGDLEFVKINIPERYGGFAQGLLSLVPVFEELGRGLVPGPYPETLAFAVPLLEKYGGEEQKQKYFKEIASGEKLFTLALYETYSQSLYDCSLQAERHGDRFVLNGVKTYVPYGEEAHCLIVPAKTSGERGTGLSLFIVDPSETGLEFRRLNCVDKTMHLAEVTFRNAAVPVGNLLGAENEGAALLQEGFLYLNAAICAMMVGGMERLVELCVEYANQRIQFGEPIGRFQAVKHKIVDMKVELEGARSLTYYAAMSLDERLEYSFLSVGSARSFTTESFIQAATKSIDIFGGMGFTWEIDCHLYLKRARAWENYIGSPDDYREWCFPEMESQLTGGMDIVHTAKVQS